MTLDELRKLATAGDDDEVTCVEGEVDDDADDDDDDDSEDAEDLWKALDHLEACLSYMEEIRVKNGKVVGLPKDMPALMEEVAEFLEQFDELRRNYDEDGIGSKL